jgi:tRNA(Ile)-lysidine synthase
MLHEAGWWVIAAHFNHALRPESDEESAAVESLAARMRILFVGDRSDVREYAADRKLSIETAARELRYRFLFAQAHAHYAQAVAVGHTADDQVETVLMHFLRGAGLKGLKGMSYRSYLQEYDVEVPLVRPLLDAWRGETEAWCAQHGLEPHYDRSNDSPEFLRNRLRHDLIPLLETYNPRFRQAAWRASKTLAADYEVLAKALQPLWQQCLLEQTASHVALDLGMLTGQSRAVQLHLLQRAARQLLPHYEIGFADLERASAFVAGSPQQADFVGGLQLLREGETLYVALGEQGLASDAWPQLPAEADSVEVQPPATVELAAGWRLTASVFQVGEEAYPGLPVDSDPFEVTLDAEAAAGPLCLRTRQAGDRFEPLGMQGRSQKLSDFMVNVKMPRRARDRWPLVCAGEQIAWVPGYRPAHWCRLRPDSGRVLLLQIVRPTGPSSQ